MKAYDFEACCYLGSVYCNGCLPDGIDTDDPDVFPIFASEEWDTAPTCDRCGDSHDYVTLLQPEPTEPTEPEWHIESKTAGKGETVFGTFPDAIRAAQANCSTDASCWTVWTVPGNVKFAEVTIRGASWVKEDHRSLIA